MMKTLIHQAYNNVQLLFTNRIQSGYQFVHCDSVLGESLRITDIDKSLNTLGLFYSSDHYKQNKRATIASLLFLASSAARYITYLILTDEHGNLSPYCFDFMQVFGGLEFYFHLVGLVTSFLTFSFVYVFGIASKNQMNWLNLIKVLKGQLPVNILGKAFFN